MPESFRQRISEIEQKTRLLVQRHKLLSERLAEANRQNQQLVSEIADYRKKVEKLESEVEYLKMASIIAPSKAEIKGTKEFLSGLVWEIDKCISQLSE